ncbi:hypothetical protein NE865_16413 [Phthorimaea operculella]|nr:hypothetical protein NE865_16413 [Phthorimaea operculella]
MAALENAVSKYPSLEGRFPQCDTFDNGVKTVLTEFLLNTVPILSVTPFTKEHLEAELNHVQKVLVQNGYTTGVQRRMKTRKERHPEVAGISFAFDPSKPPGQRVMERFVKVGDEYLVKTQMYRLCVKQYLHLGMDGFTMLKDCPVLRKVGDECLVKTQTYRLCVKQYLHLGMDGFTMLKDCPVLVEEDMCPEVGLCIQNHFAAINVRTGKSRHSRHRQSLVTLSRSDGLVIFWCMFLGSYYVNNSPEGAAVIICLCKPILPIISKTSGLILMRFSVIDEDLTGECC